MIPEWAADYFGIPFLLWGRTRAGIDCYGLVRLIFFDHRGIDLPSFAFDYSEKRKSIGSVISEKSTSFPFAISEEKKQAWDILVMRENGLPTHCALMLTDRDAIHIERGRGVEIFDIAHPMFRNRIAFVVRCV